MEGFYDFILFILFFKYEEVVTIYFNCIGHDTPKVFYGLKHFNHASIDIVVSRKWANTHFLVNYPFKHDFIIMNTESTFTTN